MAALSLKNISKKFGKTTVIQHLDLEVEDGEFIVLIGPSGCGKTTLLRMIAGLETAKKTEEGEIWIDGVLVNKLNPAKRSIAMVFQSLVLYPHMTVAKNLGFPLKIAKQDKKTIDAAVDRAAGLLKIDQLLERYPSQLSGGERQRVAIGRAIVRDPKVFLFDEPLSNLDPQLRNELRMEIRKLHATLNATMVYVTHDQLEAMTMADRIVVLNQGVLQQVGTPVEMYNQPANTFVAGFFGSPRINLLPAVLTDVASATVQIGSQSARAAVDASSLAAGAAVELGIRSEHAQLVTAGEPGALQGKVDRVELLGDVVHVFVRLDGVENPVCAKFKAGPAVPEEGAAVGLLLPVDRCLLFNAEGKTLPILAAADHL